jgi:hypothetical protein
MAWRGVRMVGSTSRIMLGSYPTVLHVIHAEASEVAVVDIHVPRIHGERVGCG